MSEKMTLSKFITIYNCKGKLVALLVFTYLLVSNNVLAQANIFNGDNLMLNSFLLYKGNDTDIKLIAKSTDYDTLSLKVPNLGAHEISVFLKFEIENRTTDFFISGFIDNPMLDEVDIYLIEEKPKLVVSTGEKFSFSERGSSFPGFNFQLFIAPGTTCTYIVRVKTAEQILVPIKIGKEKLISSEQAKKELFYGIYLGCILVMIIYNLFIYLTVRDRVYLYYVAYILTVGLTQMVLNGYASKYFWSNATSFASIAAIIIPAASGVATVVFSRNFIQTKKFTPYVDKALIFYLGVYVIIFICAFVGAENISFLLIDFNAASALILVYSAVRAVLKGYRPAKFFLVAWVIFLAGVTLFALRNFGVIPFNNLSNYGLPIGSALETVLLSFALADRINQFKKEKEDSQQKMIEVMSENQRLIEEQNVQLELKVHERTIDLEAANDELNSTLQNLKLTQNQLVEAEKLASLGQMTAGIAHEINNPINFVQSNVQPLRRDIEDILNVLNDYEGIENESDFKEKLPELKNKIKKLDIPYLKSEVTQLLSGIEEGARRTAEIVRGLRVFSRMDRDTLVSSNINDCINSTLVVMKSVTKGNVTISKKLESTMPEIMCFPGKLNQVFMNLIANAVAATDQDGRGPEDRKISVTSHVSEKFVSVEIEDNGSGIPQEIRDKIFDPFFTTKAVGEGTGLGLSIVMGIVEEHHGNIQLLSEMNKGTKFIINLPRFVVS
ncbi:MAG: 7TM diverse intracellular signaling domain-containing protein [Flavobacteriales bacterium]